MRKLLNLRENWWEVDPMGYFKAKGIEKYRNVHPYEFLFSFKKEQLRNDYCTWASLFLIKEDDDSKKRERLYRSHFSESIHVEPLMEIMLDIRGYRLPYFYRGLQALRILSENNPQFFSKKQSMFLLFLGNMDDNGEFKYNPSDWVSLVVNLFPKNHDQFITAADLILSSKSRDIDSKTKHLQWLFECSCTENCRKKLSESIDSKMVGKWVSTNFEMIINSTDSSKNTLESFTYWMVNCFILISKLNVLDGIVETLTPVFLKYPKIEMKCGYLDYFCENKGIPIDYDNHPLVRKCTHCIDRKPVLKCHQNKLERLEDLRHDLRRKIYHDQKENIVMERERNIVEEEREELVSIRDTKDCRVREMEVEINCLLQYQIDFDNSWAKGVNYSVKKEVYGKVQNLHIPPQNLLRLIPYNDQSEYDEDKVKEGFVLCCGYLEILSSEREECLESLDNERLKSVLEYFLYHPLLTNSFFPQSETTNHDASLNGKESRLYFIPKGIVKKIRICENATDFHNSSSESITAEARIPAFSIFFPFRECCNNNSSKPQSSHSWYETERKILGYYGFSHENRIIVQVFQSDLTCIRKGERDSNLDYVSSLRYRNMMFVCHGNQSHVSNNMLLPEVIDSMDESLCRVIELDVVSKTPLNESVTHFSFVEDFRSKMKSNNRRKWYTPLLAFSELFSRRVRFVDIVTKEIVKDVHGQLGKISNFSVHDNILVSISDSDILVTDLREKPEKISVGGNLRIFGNLFPSSVKQESPEVFFVSVGNNLIKEFHLDLELGEVKKEFAYLTSSKDTKIYQSSKLCKNVNSTYCFNSEHLIVFYEECVFRKKKHRENPESEWGWKVTSLKNRYLSQIKIFSRESRNLLKVHRIPDYGFCVNWSICFYNRYIENIYENFVVLKITKLSEKPRFVVFDYIHGRIMYENEESFPKKGIKEELPDVKLGSSRGMKCFYNPKKKIIDIFDKSQYFSAIGLHQLHFLPVCSFCSREKQELESLSRCERNSCKLCSRCRSAYYCSTECQKRDWPRHRQYCKN